NEATIPIHCLEKARQKYILEISGISIDLINREPRPINDWRAFMSGACRPLLRARDIRACRAGKAAAHV
ncbi:hypothetical protein, partial [Delftia acidovorans]|uniref:hypothetical protein n=1 Tax=Delftia acidovorans TaxID=80866 RepID=UPI00359F832E